MASSGNSLDVQSRMFKWRVDLRENIYFLSKPFKLVNCTIDSKWQILLYQFKNELFANLHKIESSTDNFIVTLCLNADIQKKYDGNVFDKNWIRVEECDSSYTLNIDISIESKNNTASNTDLDKLVSNYAKFYISEIFSDFTFICSDGKEIPTHRFVLAAHSPVMYRMLITPMMESKTNSAKLNDIDGETMLEVMQFLYTGKVEDIKNLGPNLLYCAEKYELTELKSFVARSMAKMINIKNVFKYFALADRYNEVLLLGPCIYFIKRNYSAVCELPDWHKIDPKMKFLLEKFILMYEIEKFSCVLDTDFECMSEDLPTNFDKYKE